MAQLSTGPRSLDGAARIGRLIGAAALIRLVRSGRIGYACGMTEAVSPEQQIEGLRRELAERDAIIAAGQAERAEAALLKARLTTALLEIERIKMQLAVLR